jgi:hypothetical protein
MAISEILQQLDQQINQLKQARQILAGGDAHGMRSSTLASGRRGRRHMSAAARARISAAQKARWAKRKGQSASSLQVVSSSSRQLGSSPRRMSVAGRARIAAAQKARWAKLKAQKKKAA